jgi:hypothetical protein
MDAHPTQADRRQEGKNRKLQAMRQLTNKKAFDFRNTHCAQAAQFATHH